MMHNITRTKPGNLFTIFSFEDIFEMFPLNKYT